MRLEEMPRVKLADLPTPLEEMKSLCTALGGPRLFFKRDDKTGLGYGGNKLRKLEYLFGEAISMGADTIVTSGAAQTNHGRLTAAAAAKLGLDCVLVITEEEPPIYEANLILDRLFGAELHFVVIDPMVPKLLRAKAYMEAGDQKIREIVTSLRTAGRNPYVIPRGGRSLQGTCGYVRAMVELYEQMIDHGLRVDHLVLPVATGSTMTGVTLGCRMLSLRIKILGISVSRSETESKALVAEEFTRDSASMELIFPLAPDDINITGSYLGEGYGIPTQETFAAIDLVAKKEGILMDPVYTGKAMAGLIDLIRQGYFREDETVVFLHTGGSPTLFHPSFYSR